MGDENKLQVLGVAELLKAIDDVSRELQPATVIASARVAASLVAGAQSSARTPLQRLAASGLRVDSGREVARVTNELPFFLGAEFGGGRRKTTKQFPAYTKRGYFFYPSARQRASKHRKIYEAEIDKASKAFDNRKYA